jgi:hypothetical protein
MPTLADLDSLYKSTVSKLPGPERVRYCNKRLDIALKLLEKHSSLLDSYQKNQVRSLVKALQTEIRKIEKRAWGSG